ncbi:MAG: hypothetical protein AAGD96_35840, partial [Chloroflexota bacterium]
MVAKKKNVSDFDLDMEKALQDALDSDLTNDLDTELSLDEYDMKVSEVADALSETAAAASETPEADAPAPALEKTDEAVAAATAAIKPSAFRPANDDDAQREYARMLARLNAKPSGSPYLMAIVVSCFWTVAAIFLAHLLYAPEIW